MIVVVDASVAVKWFVRERADERADETDAGAAADVLRAVRDGRIQMFEPPHFLAEVASVLVRLDRETAPLNLGDLEQLNWNAVESTSVYRLAMELSAHLHHHLFDTLYHATSLLTERATFVTADERYYEKAHGQGGIVRLADFDLPGTTGEAPLH